MRQRYISVTRSHVPVSHHRHSLDRLRPWSRQLAVNIFPERSLRSPPASDLTGQTVQSLFLFRYVHTYPHTLCPWLPN